MNKNTVEIVLEVDDKGSVKMKTAAGDMSKSFKGTEKSVGGLNAKLRAGLKIFKKLGSRALSIAKTMSKVGLAIGVGAAAAVAKVSHAAITRFADFETAMANVSTLVDTTKVNMAALEKGIMKIPAALGSATENAKALYQTLSAGVKPAMAVQFVADAAKAAKAGLTDTFTAVDAGTSVLNAFGKESDKGRQIFDQMFKTVEQGKTTFGELAGSIGRLSPIAAAASVRTEEMFAAIATLTKGGFATSEAVSRMATALGAVIKPSSEASKLAEKLGFDFSAAALKAKGLAGFLDSIKEATKGDVEAMGQLFGGMESLSVMLALTGKQAGEFKSILGEIESSAGAVDTAFDKQKNTLHALWETFKNTIGKQAIFLGSKLAPEIKALIITMSEWIDENHALIKSGIIEFAESVSSKIKWVNEHFKDVVFTLKELWGLAKAVGSALKWIGEGLGLDKIGKALGYAASKAVELNEALSKPAVIELKTKGSPLMDFTEGIEYAKSKLNELGGVFQQVFDLSDVMGLAESYMSMFKASKLGLVSPTFSPAEASRAIGRESAEVAQTLKKILDVSLAQLQGQRGGNTYNFSGEITDARGLAFEIQRLQQMGQAPSLGY